MNNAPRDRVKTADGKEPINETSQIRVLDVDSQ